MPLLDGRNHPLGTGTRGGQERRCSHSCSPAILPMLNSKAAREGTMSFTQQGLIWMGIGACLAPFTGGASLVLGGCHLVCGVAYDQLKRGTDKQDPSKG